MADRREEKTLLDFMAPPAGVPALPVREESRELSGLCEPEEGMSLLLLGFGEREQLRRWKERGAELLLYCDREREAASARKEGYRAVLTLSEYMEERERFDAIVLTDPSYRIYDPDRALRAMVRALRPGGRLLLELPVAGEPLLGESLLEEVLEESGWVRSVERIVRPEAEGYRRVLGELGLEPAECRLRYRSLWITSDRLEEWSRRILEPRADLLDDSRRRELLRRFRERLERECRDSGGAIVEEEALLRIDARRA
jgi:SAM-dependent methyltransferase